MNASMAGVITAIFVAGAGGESMRSLDRVRALEGCGLEGDRYCERRGYWTGTDECQVTMIEGETLATVERERGVALAAGQHRRNLVTEGLALADLAGARFLVGEAVFAYDRPRPPCRYVESITQPGMTRALGGRRGGICVRVLRSGLIHVGDAIQLLAQREELESTLTAPQAGL